MRYSDFAFRDTPPTGTAQRFHQDNGTAATSHPERIAAKHSARKHEYVCTMHYLTDVGPDSPCFSVIPQSQRFIAEGGWPEGVYNGAPEAAPDALEQFQVRKRISFAMTQDKHNEITQKEIYVFFPQALIPPEAFQPIRFYAPAGTCILYDINSFHARQDASPTAATAAGAAAEAAASSDGEGGLRRRRAMHTWCAAVPSFARSLHEMRHTGRPAAT